MFVAAPGEQRMIIMCVLMLGQRRRPMSRVRSWCECKSAQTSRVDANTWLASELDNIAKALFLYARSTDS